MGCLSSYGRVGCLQGLFRSYIALDGNDGAGWGLGGSLAKSIFTAAENEDLGGTVDGQGAGDNATQSLSFTISRSSRGGGDRAYRCLHQ